jgi:hypothetical protein
MSKTEAQAVENDAPHCPTCTCGCTCGYGGLHEPENPRCELNTRVTPPEENNE